MADWEEIKRLAADFQRTQTSDTLQRISERNCIDIVKKLTDLGLIELIYTCDGKEFLTPGHLLKEIEDEVYVNGGRVHLHDLASNLNVDYQHVENKAKELARDRSDEYTLVLGQIIHSNYKTTLGKQIYDTMITTGQLSIADFSKSLDLPSEFLLTIVKEILPQVMDNYVVSQDERTFYTTDMMDRYKAIIAGTLSAITRPTTIASIMKKIDIPERIFMPIVDGLIRESRVDASVENRLYVPSIYAREQNEWIDKFYSTNSYIDYDVLARKDIKQPKAFLKKRFSDGLALKNCFVSPNLITQVEFMIEDCIVSNGLIDIASILPASIQPEDIELMLQDLFKKNKQFSTSCLVLLQTNICSLGYIATRKQSFYDMMSDKAKEHLKQGKLVEHFLGGKPPSRSPRPMQQSDSGKKAKEEPEQQQDQQQDQQQSATKIDESTRSPDASSAIEQSQEQQKKGEDIEMTAEDLKRERRQKKSNKQRCAAVEDSFMEGVDSDDEQAGRRSKGGTSRKSGGGTQGREIKQKATKKKYFSGKGKNIDNSDNDDEQPQSVKAPRSNKGRAAKRAISPISDRSGNHIQQHLQSANARQQQTSRLARKTSGSEIASLPANKKALEFMSSEELVESLRLESRDAGEFSKEMFEFIASMMIDELNKSYESVAKETLDEHLRTPSSRTTSESVADGDKQQQINEEDENIIDLVE